MCQCGCRVSGDMSTPCQLNNGYKFAIILGEILSYHITFSLGNVSSICLSVWSLQICWSEELTKNRVPL